MLEFDSFKDPFGGQDRIGQSSLMNCKIYDFFILLYILSVSAEYFLRKEWAT